ncbi:hypothetical protein [Collimonas fungivorans]|uniref:hypothetical protein n=1 Tax=Collimonas fungivorans TaxID=158899 RepID=UPI003FA34577
MRYLAAIFFTSMSVTTQLALATQLAIAPDVGTPFILLCKATIGGQLLTQNLVVNYRDKAVNGKSAVINETMITWSDNEFDPYRKMNMVNRHELNRLAGTYRMWTEGVVYAAPLPTYHCEKAQQPKF